YATILTLALTTAAAMPAGGDRHAETRRNETHQALIDRHAQVRATADSLYQHSASRVVSDTELARRLTQAIGQGLEASSAEQARIGRSLDALTSHHDQASGHARALVDALAAPAVDGPEVRFRAGEVVIAVEQAQRVHAGVMDQLDETATVR